MTMRAQAEWARRAERARVYRTAFKVANGFEPASVQYVRGQYLVKVRTLETAYTAEQIDLFTARFQRHISDGTVLNEPDYQAGRA
jgi:hypothetical protein